MPRKRVNTMTNNSVIRKPDFPNIKPFQFGAELVPLTTWIWSVEYVDEKGGFLEQYDFDKWEFHQFREIDTSRPLVFRMKHAQDSEKPVFSLLYNPLSMKLIHFYRNGMLNNLTEFPRLHVFGYEEKTEIKNGVITTKTFLVITPKGELIVTNNMENIRF